jgi:hypothetical protein
LRKDSRFWWVTTDHFSIEQHPGWIWNTGDKMPQFFGHKGKSGLRVGDGFVLAANRNHWLKSSSGKLQVFGLYEVVKECEDNRIDIPMVMGPNSAIITKRAWLVEGKALRQFGERWRTIPTLQSLGIRLPIRNRLVNPIKRANFETIGEYLSQRKAARLGVIDREPEYEQEVIALFLSNLRRLGYRKLIRLGPLFPDGVFENDNGMQEEIEFEVYASGLKEHELGAPRKWKSVTYVCWENDLKSESRYESVRIIALSERLA